MELYKLSAAELAKMLREGKCTSTQILDSIYERIDAVEDKVEAFVTITKEQAYAKAKEIDEKFARGEKLIRWLVFPSLSRIISAPRTC